MGRMQTKLMAIALMAIAGQPARNVAQPLELKRYDAGPMTPPTIKRDKYDRAEAKRARKAQIKRNGGRR